MSIYAESFYQVLWLHRILIYLINYRISFFDEDDYRHTLIFNRYVVINLRTMMKSRNV